MHRRKIGTTALLLASACAHPPRTGPVATDPLQALRDGPPVDAASAWPLERSGPSPADTAVRFDRREGRHIVLRHGPPDNAIFVTLEFPGDTTAAPGDSLRIDVHPLAAAYGVALSASAALPRGSHGTFSYAMHFVQPAEALAAYPTPARFDQMLGAVREVGDGRIQFLASHRPASDLIRFPLTAPGTYFLAAPK